jgi:tetratricopeptide (TPR) repeat protein
MRKRIITFGAVLIAAFLAVVVYRGDRAADMAATLGDASDRRIVLLERVWDFLPINDRVFHERAKAYFDRSVNRLGETDLRDADFRRAYENYLHSLKLNPFSPRAHFDFAQSLQYMNALDLPFPERYFDEYRKAAVLAGVDHVLNFEVGKVFLSRWSGLLPEERRFAGEMIRSLLAAGERERSDRLAVFLRLWELNVREIEVLKMILPADPESFRQAARFLGEKSLDRGARLDFLAKAEILDLQKAREEVLQAQADLRTRRSNEALDRLRTAWNLLEGIRFYQNLLPKAGLDPVEWKALRKTVKLGILKVRLETSRSLVDVAEDLRAYLEIEDSPGALGELETLLKARDLIDDKARSGVQDLDRLTFRLALRFKQNRFREVVQTGQALTQSFLVVPDDQRVRIGRLFEIVGEACQKLNDLYESNAFFERAISLGVSDVGIRLKMRRNFERLNDAVKLKEIQPLIEELLTGRETPLSGLLLTPEVPQARLLALDEKTYRMRLLISNDAVEPFPLMSVFFNGRIVYEDYLKSASVDVDLPAVLGENRLEIIAVNRSVQLVRLELISEEAARVPKDPEVSRKYPEDGKYRPSGYKQNV